MSSSAAIVCASALAVITAHALKVPKQVMLRGHFLLCPTPVAQLGS